MQDTAATYSHIKGWRMDADRNNDPTYPMRHRLDNDEERYTWQRPTQQPIDIEVLRSIERPNVTAVFGTSTPPAGFSGVLRRIAFKYSESSYVHWLPLMLADRIGVVEGVLDDLKRGHVPNILAEAGYQAEWKYNRWSVVRRVLVGAALSSAAIGYRRSRSSAKSAWDDEATLLHAADRL